MSRYVKVSGFLAVLLLACLPLGCAGSQGTEAVSVTDVPQGEMPDGASWSGVYFSQTYGNLHLIEQAGTVTGKWRTTNGEAWGELAGEAKGDVLRYEWTEHTIGMVGPSATKKGRGYFKYKPSSNGVDPDEIAGQWGMGTKDSGYTWSAVKQRNVKPDPDSVRPDELEKRGQGGGWDDEGASRKPKPAGGEGEGGGEPEPSSDDSDKPSGTGPNSEF